jgi:hypothetical protein
VGGAVGLVDDGEGCGVWGGNVGGGEGDEQGCDEQVICGGFHGILSIG